MMRWEQILKNNSVLNSTIIIPQFLFHISLLHNPGFARVTHTFCTLSSRCKKNFAHVTFVSPTPVNITPIFRRQSVQEQSFIQLELHDTCIHLFCPPPPPKLLLSDFPILTLVPFLSFGLILLSGRNANTHSSQPSMCILNPPPNSFVFSSHVSRTSSYDSDFLHAFILKVCFTTELKFFLLIQKERN